MRKMQFITNFAAAVALLASTAVLPAEPILYSTTGGGSTWVRIDVGAGTVTTIGDFGVPGAFAIAINPDGKLYTVTQGYPAGGANPQLASVNRATGVAEPFGANLNPESFMGLGFSPEGKLYGVNADSGTRNQNSLYRFDLKNGKAERVGVKGACGDIMDLAWHPDGTLYGVAWNSLYRINQQTGRAELVTTLEGLTAVMGLAIDDDGNFYVSEIVDNSPLWRVDPVSGAATAVAGVSLSYPHGLEFAPTEAEGDQNHGDATVNFTKWITAYPNMMGEITGGDVGDGEYTGEILSRVVDSQGVITIEADYHLHGSKHSFTARIHAEQKVAGIGQKAVIIGVVTDGWLKGHAVAGEWTVIPPCSGLGNCFEVTLNIIKRHSDD